MLLFVVFTLALFSFSFGARTMRRGTLPVVERGKQCSTVAGKVATCASGLQCCPVKVGVADNSVCMAACPITSEEPGSTGVTEGYWDETWDKR
ncbi:hypothetical protein BDZ89DRAFT_1133908 [Hymenopellis radicata]|nr:hypothetical protein BDZ89DRAFT_1133908 [Hymenopellis radicata]